MSQSVEKSEEHSQSSSVIEVNEVRLPENCVVVQFESVDPTKILDNADNSFGSIEHFEFYEKPIQDSEVKTKLLDLLNSYRDLILSTEELNIKQLSHQLDEKTITNKDIYHILDKIYLDIPASFEMSASFLSVESLPLIVKKRCLHKKISQDLTVLQDLLTSQRERIVKEYMSGKKDKTPSKVDDDEDDEDDEEDDEEEDSHSDCEKQKSRVKKQVKQPKVKKQLKK